ncbi:hypothetical protein PR002_g7003 [Phytophthora rubi]|uniref:Uncharacterized protein n=1 Tax=Phytophthora rubi TaxID=129364 RepID=A0A6A3MYV7_9STRA|nr:hypothetical protein PR002_g7003 [Phytophthora rubi]
MTPSRTARSHLLVTPDLIGFAWEAPVYCKVVRMGPRDVRIEGLHDAAGNTWSIKRSDAVSCTVAASEARSNTSGPLLRQAVMTEHEDAFHHGQVVSASESQVSIRLMDETLATSADNATPVAPAVALLLEELTFATSEWSLDEMVSLHHEILDRICGTNNSNGSNDISIILADLVDSASYPASEDIRTWIDPKTGELSSFPLRHAIDYVYHVDGGILPVPALVGPSFCQPPSRQPRRHDVNSASRRRPSASSDRLQLFDPELDDDDDSSSETSADATHINTRSSRKRAVGNSKRNRPVTKQRVESQQPGDDAEKDALIAQLLIDRPGLTERILQLRSDAALQTSFTHALAPAQRLLENSVQSLQDRNPARESPQADQDQQDVKQRSKYSFVPSVTQRRIHALVTALRHQAKSVSIFLEALINSGFVLFKPFPSVLGRAFAIEFGIRGLSFMHFMPFSDLSDKAVWIATSGVNMQKKISRRSTTSSTGCQEHRRHRRCTTVAGYIRVRIFLLGAERTS